MMTGHLTAARSALEQSLTENPSSIETVAYLATCCRRQHDKEAERLYSDRLLAETAPGAPGANGRRTERALALFRAGRTIDALELLAQLDSPWQTAASSADLTGTTGMCLLALGRPEAPDTLRRGAAGDHVGIERGGHRRGAVGARGTRRS